MLSVLSRVRGDTRSSGGDRGDDGYGFRVC